jgi:hypothetical protein
VIVERSTRLESKEEVAQFIGLIGMLLTNGKMVDQHFVLNPAIIGGGKKDLRDAKDVPQNMTALGGFIKISKKSVLTFQKKLTLVTGKKKGGGNLNYADLVYFTFAMSCDVATGDLATGIMVEWMRAGGVGLYLLDIYTGVSSRYLQ